MSNGFGISDILKQAQQLQENLGRMKEEASHHTVEGTAGGGMVRATMNGNLELLALTIDPAAVRDGDLAMLQDLVIAAINQAIRAAQQQMANEMQKFTGGLKIPGFPS